MELREKYGNDVGNSEREADRVTAEVNRLLHKTFITPIDREQIHSLITAMDDILDLLHAGTETMQLWGVRAVRAVNAVNAVNTVNTVNAVNTDISRLGEISAKCSERVQHAVSLLPRISHSEASESAIKTCEEIIKLKSNADRVMRSAMSKLFREKNDTRELIKLKTMNEQLESVSNHCEAAVNLIGGVVLVNP